MRPDGLDLSADVIFININIYKILLVVTVFGGTVIAAFSLLGYTKAC